MNVTPKMEIRSYDTRYNDEEHVADYELRIGNRYLSLRAHNYDVHGGIDDIIRAVNAHDAMREAIISLLHEPMSERSVDQAQAALKLAEGGIG